MLPPQPDTDEENLNIEDFQTTTIDVTKGLADEDGDNGFDSKDIEQATDGWELYRRKKIHCNLVKKYC
jgi:hypothetical protein